jgi:hypothetical protein
LRAASFEKGNFFQRHENKGVSAKRSHGIIVA